MVESKLYRARVRMVEGMEQGLSWDEAAKQAELQIGQSTAYRLRQRMRRGGKQALQEGRQAPHTPSHEIQAQLAERFGLSISVSQLKRVRATLGVSNPPQSAKKT